MPRFACSNGRASKLWEIELSGRTLTTTYGKPGPSGQTTIDHFNSEAQARKEYDKLVAEKTRKGYRPVGAKVHEPANAAPTPTGTGARDARNAKLEAAIAANPTDRDAFAVFADWLQEQGDPRGELISLQLAHKDAAARQLIAKHADYFLGPLAAHQTTYDEGDWHSGSHLRSKAQQKEWEKTRFQAFLWRHGFISRVRLSYDHNLVPFEGDLAQVLADVFTHASGRYVTELAFNANGGSRSQSLQPLIDAIAKHAPPTIRKITFGDNIDQISWHVTGDLGKLWKRVPGLRTLEIETGKFAVGKMIAPSLERARFITGGLPKATAKGIATAEMPKIEHLEIYFGQSEYGGDCSIKEVKPLLDRGDLRHLRYLGLKNSEFANEIARAIGTSKIVRGLTTLDLSLGTMTDEGAEALAAAKDKLRHLEVLDLTRNYLTKRGIAAVKGICPKVVTAKQETADEDFYFTDIGE